MLGIAEQELVVRLTAALKEYAKGKDQSIRVTEGNIRIIVHLGGVISGHPNIVFRIEPQSIEAAELAHGRNISIFEGKVHNNDGLSAVSITYVNTTYAENPDFDNLLNLVDQVTSGAYARAAVKAGNDRIEQGMRIRDKWLR